MSTWPVAASVVGLVAAAVVLVVLGPRLARLADHLADRTGMGEAIAGAVLLGATTSLPGIVTTGVAASEGDGTLAVSNALGGIAAQTMFLALADLRYRRANLEHAAASLPNLLQTLVLVALLALVLMAAVGPEAAVGWVHPVTVVLPLAYLFGLRLTRTTDESPMWQPEHTDETRLDEPDEDAGGEALGLVWLRFALVAAGVAAAGWVVGQGGVSLAERTPLSGSVVGGLLTSVVTSLPELVTAFAAVRIGALTLAVGDIVGGNTFDVLFVGVADVAFTGGSVYHHLEPATLFLLGMTLVLTSVLAAGLVHRGRDGIGFEGLTILGVYVLGAATLLLSG